MYLQYINYCKFRNYYDVFIIAKHVTDVKSQWLNLAFRNHKYPFVLEDVMLRNKKNRNLWKFSKIAIISQFTVFHTTNDHFVNSYWRPFCYLLQQTVSLNPTEDHFINSYWRPFCKLLQKTILLTPAKDRFIKSYWRPYC